ncbi:MAG: hypothetical protein ACLPVO_05990 [Desulfomonilaceae bacterium]
MSFSKKNAAVTAAPEVKEYGFDQELHLSAIHLPSVCRLASIVRTIDDCSVTQHRRLSDYGVPGSGIFVGVQAIL